MKRKPVIVAYDISSPLRRRRVHKLLLGWRVDGQKSVHECLLNDREAEELYLQIRELIDDDDRLMLAWLTPRARVDGCGQGAVESLFRRMVKIT